MSSSGRTVRAWVGGEYTSLKFGEFPDYPTLDKKDGRVYNV